MTREEIVNAARKLKAYVLVFITGTDQSIIVCSYVNCSPLGINQEFVWPFYLLKNVKKTTPILQTN